MPRVKQFDPDEVLAKALQLFWKKGYHATTVQDLVDGLGINRGSLYDTFGGKKKLFDLAIKLYTSTNRQLLCAMLSPKDEVRLILRSVFQRIIEADLEDPDCKGCFVVNTTTELLPQDEQLQPIIGKYQQDITQLFIELLERGISRGEISEAKNIGAIAHLLYTLMTGLRVVGKAGGNRSKSEDAVDAVLVLLD